MERARLNTGTGVQVLQTFLNALVFIKYVRSYRWKGVVWRNLEKGSELKNFIDSISKLQLDICVYY